MQTQTHKHTQAGRPQASSVVSSSCSLLAARSSERARTCARWLHSSCLAVCSMLSAVCTCVLCGCVCVVWMCAFVVCPNVCVCMCVRVCMCVCRQFNFFEHTQVFQL